MFFRNGRAGSSVSGSVRRSASPNSTPIRTYRSDSVDFQSRVRVDHLSTQRRPPRTVRVLFSARASRSASNPATIALRGIGQPVSAFRPGSSTRPFCPSSPGVERLRRAVPAGSCPVGIAAAAAGRRQRNQDHVAARDLAASGGQSLHDRGQFAVPTWSHTRRVRPTARRLRETPKSRKRSSPNFRDATGSRGLRRPRAG